MSFAREILKKLAQCGVEDVIVCAGARNAEFVFELDSCEGVNLFSFFEERSAGFFALGKSVTKSKPVAVITTSGTAVAELLPAVIEAHYVGAELVVITADRPKRFRGSGAPQAIEQVGIFSHYVENPVDLSADDNSCPDKINFKSPTHWNVCFEEPKNKKYEKWQWPKDERPHSGKESEKKDSSAIQFFMEQSKCPLIIVSSLDPQDREGVRESLLNWNLPVYVEGTSGLRGELSQSIRSGERTVSSLLECGSFDGVIRIGGVPTLRAWRDLEAKFSSQPVISFSRVHLTGLGRDCFGVHDLSELGCLSSFSKENKPEVEEYDAEKLRGLEKLFIEEPNSEPALFHSLSKLVGKDEFLFVGNSMPIRLWDLCSQRKVPVKVWANRGANGIDGQVSSFLGGVESFKRNSWGVFGDLTALYDLSSLWALKQFNLQRTRTVVVNNQGGQIFSRIFQNSSFLNEHQIEFSHWAKLWGIQYENWRSIPDTFESDENVLIEISPDAEATQRFWQKYDRIWST